MERLFAVLRSRGPSWDDSKPLEGQALIGLAMLRSWTRSSSSALLFW